MRPVQPAGFTDRWRTVPLWTLFRRVARRGRETEDLLSVYRDHGVVPRGFTDDNWNRTPDDLSNYLLVEPGDLVLNKMKAWQGSLGVSRLRGIVSPAYFVFAPVRRGYDERFLHHLLRSRPFVESYGRMSGGIRVDQWDLDPWAFSRLVVPVPQISEQRAIADFVDRETAKIDALIAKQNEMVWLLRERRESLIATSVTRGLRPSADLVERGITWQGPTPANWSAVPLRSLLRLQKTPVGNKWASTTLLSLTKRGVITRDIDSGEGKFPASFETYQSVEPGDLVLCLFDMDETPRTVGLAHQHGMVTGAYTRFKVNRSMVSPEYLEWAFIAIDDGKRFRPLYTGLRKVIQKSRLLSAKLALPPLDEQRQIVDHIDRETAKIDALIAKAEEHIALAQERRAALITAAVTGQIDITGKVA